MKIFQVQGCPFAHRARIALEEKKLPYEVVYFTPRERPAELAAVSPDAKSPTIFDDDGKTIVWNSMVVIEYLEERYPDQPLMPRDARDRARARLMMREVEDKLMAAVYVLAQELVHKPAAERDENKVREGIGRLHDILAPWHARLEGKEFLIGDRFTLADVVLFTPLYSLDKLLGERGELPASLGNLRMWRDAVAKRPSTAY
jgi:glutathione S-transferase